MLYIYCVNKTLGKFIGRHYGMTQAREPLVGAIWLLVLMLKDSNPGENQYGQNPKEVTA
jgi:uncharacterized membrane protein YhaH (DUF805 family)